VDAEHVEVARLTDWRTWLRRNHQQPNGVWLVYPRSTKKQSGLTYDEMVDEAVCWGWIDSRPGKVDDEHAKLFFSPRKATSGWSAKNKHRVSRLLGAGRLQPSGLKVIEVAKKSGAWTKLDDVEKLEIPVDLGLAFQRLPGAEENFQSFSRTNKRMVLEWISNAKKPETRQRRVDETAAKAFRNEVANLWVAKKNEV